MARPSPSSAHASLASFAKRLAIAAAWLTALPVITILFTAYGNAKFDSEYTEWVESRGADVLGASYLGAEQLITPSRACSEGGIAPAYADSLCEVLGEVWQFDVAGKVGEGAMWLALSTALAVVGLGLMARGPAHAQYRSLAIAWRLLPMVAAIEVILQGALLLWLSFWITALLFKVYYIKLILLGGVVAAVAVFTVLTSLFRRPRPHNTVDGELLVGAGAAPLWQRLHGLAQRLGTTPPQHVAAGIDANFFVTEAPHEVGGTPVTGRLLYVSLPLLRVLSSEEADAVLAHELAHLRHGDTTAGAKLGLLLQRYDHYLGLLANDALSRLPLAMLLAYRELFELARSRASREREFAADRVAAEAVHPLALARALVKIQAYASHRASVIDELFEQQVEHQGELHLGSKLYYGLLEHTRSSSFQRELADECIPHPFDSHPPLDQRLHAIGVPFAPEQVQAIVAAPTGPRWVDAIANANELEMKQWQSFERDLSDVHAQNLVYRYLPATPEERAYVEREFPPRSLHNDSIQLTCEAIVHKPGAAPIALTQIKAITQQGGVFGTQLQLQIEGKLLPLTFGVGRGEAAKAACEAIGRYWGRACAARDFHAARKAHAS